MFKNKLKKEKAIALRKEGNSLSEILKHINVAKSTLSLWLKDVGLSKAQHQRLTAKRLEAARRGGKAKRQQRILRMEKINEETLADITHITKRELWLIGIALYWAEGSKEKEYRLGTGLQFGNSDPRMIKLFIRWLKNQGVSIDRLKFEIYIHKNSVNSIDYVKPYWSKATGFPLKNFNHVYYKKNKIKTNRKNIGSLYYGGLRVRVSESSGLNRRIAGWTEAIVRSVK